MTFAGRFSSLLLLSLLARPSVADVRLPHLFSDHAVLQRDRPIHLWGWGTPGESVTVSLGAAHAATTVTPEAEWSVYLPPMAAGGGALQLVVKGTNTITVSDLLMGDVWFASGQSNMEMPLAGFGKDTPIKNGEQEIAAANEPQIRLLKIPTLASNFPTTDTPSTWTTCTPETARTFSAVAYFFGREISRKEKVPIGLIDSAWGGTPAEVWVSMDGLARNTNLAPVFLSYARFQAGLSNLDSTVAAEKAEDASALAAGKPAPRHPWHPNPVSWAPANLYNAMVAPFTPLSIRGVIWYQGETNSSLEKVGLYHELFATLISNWREKFGQGDLPFIYAQISNFRSTPLEAWGALRDGQRRTLSVANTGMAVTLDVGNPANVHPADKETVGHRMALAARGLSYGEKLNWTGPVYERTTRDGTAMRVWFTGGKLADGPVAGFEIAGADHRFVAAEAHVEAGAMKVSASSVTEPRYVRYGWSNFTDGNLKDVDGLPASTFTSEDSIESRGILETAHK